MAYFDCTIGGASGDGVALIVNCNSSFAGSVITADNGEDSFSDTCPSVAPYTVRFDGIPTGTYTISGEAEGQTFTTQFTVLDYETTLNSTPEGATVTPTDDVQIWLHCAGIWDKNYTTVAQVIADATTLLALISDNNAADYMVRSTTFTSDICSDSTAMGYIGNNNYCANILLADSTWNTAICNSTYYESVLNTKVPTMTSNTAPSGKALGTSYTANQQYCAFDGLTGTNNLWFSPTNGDRWVGYQFPNNSKVIVGKITMQNRNSTEKNAPKNFKLQGSNDGGATWNDVASYTNTNNNSSAVYSFSNTNIETSYNCYRIYVIDWFIDTTAGWTCLAELQFYGRVDA